MKKTIVLGSLLFCILSTPGYTQSATENTSADSLKVYNQQKRALTPGDYQLWSKIYGQKISDNGKWYAYNLWYVNKKDRTDSLFVGTTQKEITYRFPLGSGGQFSTGSRWFACLVPEWGLALLDLEKDSLQWISHINRFEFSKDGRYLIGLGKASDSLGSSRLWIMDLKFGKRESIAGVTEFLLHSSTNKLAYIIDSEEKRAVKLLRLGTSSTTSTIAKNSLNPYKKLVWNDQGSALAFFRELPKEPERQKGYTLYYYSDKRKRSNLQCLDSTIYASQFPDMYLTDSFLKVSEDESAVFFKVKNREEVEGVQDSIPQEVRVWVARDKTEQNFKKHKKKGAWKNRPKLAVWWPEKDKTVLLETDSLPIGILTGDRKHLLSYNPFELERHFKNTGDIDFYLTDFETGQCRLFLQQQEKGQFDSYGTHVSPGGKYINYFRNGHWWVYDLENKTHRNITKGLGVPVYDIEFDRPTGLQPYGAPGWTQGDKELVVYDQYDVWLLSPKGNVHRRITKGREAQIRYRIDRQALMESFHKRWFSGFELQVFNLSKGLMLETLGSDMASGYSLYKPGKDRKELVFTDMRVNGLKKAGKRNAYIFTEQSFDTPPRIRYWEPGMRKPKTLVETNPQQKRFRWGHSELVNYPGPNGKPLKGALFYPANYTKGRKYPMIVKIYEILSPLLHHYIPPSKYLQDGWNPTNYTAEGYFVFLPDIRYTLNDPGISAVECIESGVKAVLTKGDVDKNRIGLNGHSFGGYQTAFTITQSDLFAAAVAGAGVMDLVSWYHSVDWNSGKDRMWWFEDQQYRIQDSYYKNQDAYLRNSPLHHAGNINTPLLLWTGEEDYVTDWRQSIKMYLGLRRQDKESELLIYPGERHTMLKRKNQVDLTRRIKKWFARYLKPQKKGEGTE